jgi:predicted aldo/keto reductase-like oxidoreductase
MKYRRFGRLDKPVSALGFGCMRLPTQGEDRSSIDEAEAARMLHYAIDNGVNYVDTAYGYHGGNSERFLGRALQGGYREKVTLATKLPMGQVEQTGDFDRLLNEQLEKLQTDHIDCYLFHGLRAPRWELVLKLGLLERAEKALADGRIRHLGFSFHDSFEVFKQIIDGFNWTMCQIQYNYMNEEIQAGTKGLQYAASKGIAVVVMEPLLGGKLVNPPKPVQALWDTALWDTAERKRTPADWALQWLWSKPEVAVALSGMSAMPQVQENVASANKSGVGALTTQELALIRQVSIKYDELTPIPCTQCGYCMPCPNGVDIPRNLSLFNNGAIYAAPEDARRRYQRIAEGARASDCIQCRECEELCPQKIEISAWMPKIHEVLGVGKSYDEVLH